ncbi:DsbA family protein [Agromyces seonyuensis]|uniref:Thioredoxin domain-containing protein n=1 Tax=Agromyces seonyuensis TaxID=2662446 RepID=A0A6I4NS84_9MICO|nr:thioredoxin domain-containing protein [Agromyces seonyuensis]MWB97020.1 thioredoxin domain-containing protein [Agromyces seonyuensis]
MTRGTRRAGALGTALLAALLLVGCASGGSGGSGGDVLPSDQAVPTGTEGAAHFDDYALVTGEGSIDVQLWFDLRCPICQQFEEAAGEQIAGLVDDGTITYSLHPMNFLDRVSAGTYYSSRAGSALTCVAVEDPDALLDAMQVLYEAQPEEGTEGLTNTEINGVLEDGGIEGLGECVDEMPYTSWVQASNDAALAGIEGADVEAIQGTPTLIVNGTSYQGSVSDADAIIDFITSGGQS